MIGFDAIGQSAVAELGVEGDAIVFAPAAAAVSAGVVSPFVAGGKSVAPAAKAVTATLVAPVVRGGANIAVPAAAVSVASSAAAVRISATVTVGSSAVAATRVAPAIFGGKKVAVPAAAVTVAVTVPKVAAGKSVKPPSASVAVTSAALGISISATISPATVGVAVTTAKPEILGGNFIEAVNTVTMITPYGEVASSSIGQFAIGEGELSTRIVKVPPLVVVSTTSPFITAGKSVRPPVAAVAVTSARAEIASRGRKLRLYAIAS